MSLKISIMWIMWISVKTQPLDWHIGGWSLMLGLWTNKCKNIIMQCLWKRGRTINNNHLNDVSIATFVVYISKLETIWPNTSQDHIKVDIFISGDCESVFIILITIIVLKYNIYEKFTSFADFRNYATITLSVTVWFEDLCHCFL